MKNIKLGYGTSKEDWKELINQLKEVDGLTVVNMPETDNDGFFVDFQYVTIEHRGQFYYIQKETYGRCFQVTPYIKVNPWEKIQADYSYDVTNSVDLIEFITTGSRIYDKPLTCKNGRNTEICPKQRLYLTDGFYTIYEDGTKGMQHFKNLFGNREREIFDTLEKIENVMTTKDYKVLRFHSNEGYFDYECKSKRITG